MTRQKHRPQRTCVGCRQVKDKRALIRIVRTPEKEIIVDPIGKANGRGVYLCRETECLDKGLKRISQALKVNLSPEEFADIRILIQNELSKN